MPEIENPQNITPEQLDGARQLQLQVGQAPERMFVDNKYGILRLDYCRQGRHFFLDRDGKRIFWSEPAT
jgi:hypothetical protein